jgi:ribonucleoside-diphosphate reductase alpha chain
MIISKYEELSNERKYLAAIGENPEWLTTPAWQLIQSKYLTGKDSTLLKTFKRIAKTAAKHLPDSIKSHYEKRFFEEMWSGNLALSTPILANMGTDKGLPVSCTGNYCEDTVSSFYDTTKECAVLSQLGFGTSTYLGDIRPRGSKISKGGTASGVLPVIKQLVQMSRDISQGVRRGAWAGYIEITHGDFWEIVNYLEHNPQDLNIGWNITDEFVEGLLLGNKEYLNRYKRALKVKLITGKGYFFFVDKVNRNVPYALKSRKLKIKASNLCTEITQPSNENLSFTCVLSSLNLANYDDWPDDLVEVAIVFLDCVCSEFIDKAKDNPNTKKVLNYTEKSRALGLGALGFHTYLQKKMIAIDSIDAVYINTTIFSRIHRESIKASKMLAEKLGSPEFCRGTGLRNLFLNAVAPNTSSAVIAGSVSQGIEPFYANAFVQSIAGGEVNRLNPVLIDIMKERGVYNDSVIRDLILNEGSVQHVDWLDDSEKKVFLTAFEIDQRVLIRLASSRQRYIDQAQSINLFFPSGVPEEYISEIHKEAFLNENIKSLYYIRSNSSNKASTGEACSACAS